MQTEWSMGNGQCPMCGGLGPLFARQERPVNIGHVVGCPLGVAMQGSGQKVLWRGAFTPSEEQRAALCEHDRYWTILAVLMNDGVVSEEELAWYTEKQKQIWKDRIPKIKGVR